MRADCPAGRRRRRCAPHRSQAGAPPTFTPEQICAILALACEPPQGDGRELTHWTHADLAPEASARGIVESISPDFIGRCLREADRKPHRGRGWSNTPRDEQFDEQCQDVCETYRLAPERAAAGIETHRIDAMTGVQVRARCGNLAGVRRPGRTPRARVHPPRHPDPRTEQDFAHWLGDVLAQRGATTRWHLVMDNLNIHCSAAVVRLDDCRKQTYRMAQDSRPPSRSGSACIVVLCARCRDKEGGRRDKPGGMLVDRNRFGRRRLGARHRPRVNGKRGILQAMATGERFLRDPSRRIGFHFTPKHASWRNQIEMRLSILARRVIRHGKFLSVDDLREKLSKIHRLLQRNHGQAVSLDIYR